MQFKKITIVGLGLMGGSLAAACRRAFPKARIFGVSRDKEALRLSVHRGWTHQSSADLADGVRGADLIVLCTPVDTLKVFLRKIDSLAKAETVVTDVGSVKNDLLRWAAKQKFKNIEFVGAHPMVGSHERGIQACRPDLYDRGFTFVVQSPRFGVKAFRAASFFWNKISPKIFVLNAEKHDRIVGEISHLPHLTAAALVLSTDKKSLPYAGQGFRDTTRIAQGDASIWAPIFQANRTAILKALGKFESKLHLIKKALQEAELPKLEAFFEKSSKERRQLMPSRSTAQNLQKGNKS